jgi:Kelch motif/Galactose oxidase, central domain
VAHAVSGAREAQQVHPVVQFLARRTAIVAQIAATAAIALAGCAGADIAEMPVTYTNRAGEQIVELAMTTPRENHAAVALKDGRVLISGGSMTAVIGGTLASAELYDPAAHTFLPTAAMPGPRMGHTATLLNDGRVLITGGVSNVGFRAELASAEIYDPSRATFTPTGAMSTPREGHTATLLSDGRVLVAGGSDNGTHALDSAEIYDPVTGRWTPTGTMTVPREAHVAVRLRSRKVLIAGGGRGDMPGGYIAYQSAEIYDPVSGTFSKVAAPMKRDRVGAAALLLHDGRPLIVSGKSGKMLTGPGAGNLASFTPLRSAELYDPELGTFTETAPMREPHYLATATRLDNGDVLVTGGWRMQGAVVGGMEDAEVFEPRDDRWFAVGRLHTPRLLNTATLLPGGEVLVAGGMDAQGQVTATVEFYDPTQHRFIRRSAPPPTASAPSTRGAPM